MSKNIYLNFVQQTNLISFPKFDKTMFSSNAISQILRLRKKTISIWSDFIRRPRKLSTENYICVVKGQEQFKIVSPIFRKNLYVGVLEKYALDESPLSFISVDYKRFPFAKMADFVDATLNAGDCMYVPAYYYVQSKTSYMEDSKESIVIIQEYDPHSQFVNLMFDALEGEKLTDDK